MKNSPILIDTDMGLDDIIAITMLLASCPKKIIGISTVFGLVDPTIGAQNLIKIMRYVNFTTDVCVGSQFHLRLSSRSDTFPKIDQLNSTKIQFLQSILPRMCKISFPHIPVETWLMKKISEASAPVTLLCLGPLTNSAKLLQKYGDTCTKNISRLVIMGGAIKTRGNVPPEYTAEYNFFLDPKAASIVCSSPVSIDMISLDVTSYLPFKTRCFDTLSNNPYKILIDTILKNNKNDFDYLYDPLVAAAFLKPSLVTYSKKQSLRIIQQGKNRGASIPIDRSTNNIRVAQKIDTKLFYSVLDAIRKK